MAALPAFSKVGWAFWIHSCQRWFCFLSWDEDRLWPQIRQQRGEDEVGENLNTSSIWWKEACLAFSAPCLLWDLSQVTAALWASVHLSGQALCGFNKTARKAQGLAQSEPSINMSPVLLSLLCPTQVEKLEKGRPSQAKGEVFHLETPVKMGLPRWH